MLTAAVNRLNFGLFIIALAQNAFNVKYYNEFYLTVVEFIFIFFNNLLMLCLCYGRIN